MITITKKKLFLMASDGVGWEDYITKHKPSL